MAPFKFSLILLKGGRGVKLPARLEKTWPGPAGKPGKTLASPVVLCYKSHLFRLVLHPAGNHVVAIAQLG